MVPFLNVSSVSHTYGRHAALVPVTFAIDAGRCVGVVGPNGAGKTTLLRIAAGLIRPRCGEVTRWKAGDPPRYFGGEATLPPRALARRWARLTGGGTVTENRRIGRLSRGTRQLLGLRVVLHIDRPVLILLDEPWEGLDPDGSRWLSDEVMRLKNAGCALVISSHRLHDLGRVSDAYLFLGGPAARWVENADGAIGGTALCHAFDAWRRGQE